MEQEDQQTESSNSSSKFVTYIIIGLLAGFFISVITDNYGWIGIGVALGAGMGVVFD